MANAKAKEYEYKTLISRITDPVGIDSCLNKFEEFRVKNGIAKTKPEMAIGDGKIAFVFCYEKPKKKKEVEPEVVETPETEEK
jgi:hypothetical protein